MGPPGQKKANLLLTIEALYLYYRLEQKLQGHFWHELLVKT